MQQRAAWIDYVKAIGIMLVVYGHVARGAFNAGLNLEPNRYQLIDSLIYSFHMPLFFFLVGVCFCQSIQRQGRAGFLFSKLDTVFYPYVLWSLLQGGIEVGLSQYTNGQVTLTQVLSLLWQPRAHFWFLYALVLIFIFATVLLYRSPKLLTKNPAQPLSWRYLWLLVAVFGLCFCYQNQLPNFLNLGFFANNFVFFVLGVMLTQSRFSLFALQANRAGGHGHYVVLILALVALMQWGLHGHFAWRYGDGGVGHFLLALGCIVALVALGQWLEQWQHSAMAKPLAWLQFIGASSMAIYLAHVLAGSGVRIVLAKGLGLDLAWLHLLLGSLAGIFLPLLLLWAARKLGLTWLFHAPLSAFCQRWYKTEVKAPDPASR